MSTLDDITFDLPEKAAATELCRLLRSSGGELELSDEGWSVHAALGEDPVAVSALLRMVEAWVAERGLRAIRFRLDDRWYVMESGELECLLEAA